MPKRFVIITVAFVVARNAAAQVPAFEPFPAGTVSHYKFDLGRNFYSTIDAARSEQTAIIARATQLVAEARHIKNAGDLYAVLTAWDSVSRLAGKQYAYFSLRTSVDMKDAGAQEDVSRFAGRIQPLVTELDRLLGAIPAIRFREFETAETRLRKYGYAAELARRNELHRPDSSTQKVLDEIEPHVTSWGTGLFQSSLIHTNWGTVEAGGRKLDVRKNGNEIRNHPDRAVREQGFRLGQAGIASRQDLFAFIMTRQAAARNDVAQLRRWPDYVEQTYAASGLDPAAVKKMLAEIGRRAESNKRYERVRNEEIRAALGLDTVHTWDLTAPLTNKEAPRFTIQQAAAHIIAASQPLGEAYVREMRALLEPSNGRLDLMPRPNRIDRPGFATGSVGFPSMFFQGRFEGFVDDILILGHEAAHATQSMLMDAAGVLPRYAHGPNYFTESFAIFGELLLLEHLARTEESSADRNYFQRRLIESGLELFRYGHESRVELMVFDSVRIGRLLDAAELEQMTQSVGSEYSIWFGPGSEREFAWVQPIQFYTRPLYRVNYVLAKLLALRYLELLHRDPTMFARAYAALLQNGYDAPPEVLLKRFLNIDFANGSELAASAISTLDEWVAEYSPMGQ